MKYFKFLFGADIVYVGENPKTQNFKTEQRSEKQGQRQMYDTNRQNSLIHSQINVSGTCISNQIVKILTRGLDI